MFETDKERDFFFLCWSAAEDKSRGIFKLLHARDVHRDCVTREASFSMFILIS
jgi:hypothetical protein